MKRSGFNNQSRRAKAKRRVRLDADQRWRLAVREKDDYTCQFPGCGIRLRSIHAHHVAPRSRRPDLKYVVENGKCMCAEHHGWVHDHPIEAIELRLLSDESYERSHKEQSDARE